jgi:hypothetical protein
VLFIYIKRLVSNEIFSPSNKIHRKVGRAKDLSAPLYLSKKKFHENEVYFITFPVNPSKDNLIKMHSAALKMQQSDYVRTCL